MKENRIKPKFCFHVLFQPCIPLREVWINNYTNDYILVPTDESKMTNQASLKLRLRYFMIEIFCKGAASGLEISLVLASYRAGPDLV